MATVEFDRVVKRYGDIHALDGVSLAVAHGELVAVLGPSGCGKSTLLRVTAGLEPLDGGAIRLGGARLDTQPPERREVAMVFQSYALYPHMTVRANIEFPLRMRGVAAAARQAHAQEVAAILELGPLLDRRPKELSGGQRQRVALARALVRDPALFLLDEPLSNLDAQLRLGVREYLRVLQRRLAVTMLYVTHDQGEALALGDRVAVLRDGRLQQLDTAAAVYERPANAFVAGFVGTPPMNLLEARHSADVLLIGGRQFAVPAAARPRVARAPSPLRIGIRPEAFTTDAADGIEVLVDPASRQVLGSETLAFGSIGTERVSLRLFGLVRDLPPRLAAPFDALHLFAADAAGARIEDE